MRVEEVRTWSFLTLACSLFFCSPVKQSMEVEKKGDRREEEGEGEEEGETDRQGEGER